jgi:hypothetical protein
MSQANMRDRAPRYDIRLSAEIRRETARITGTTRNLSIGGVCVEIDRPIEEGTSLALTLFIVEEGIETEGARGLELKGTVQWLAESDRGYAVGIKFVNVTGVEASALTHALRALGEPVG